MYCNTLNNAEGYMSDNPNEQSFNEDELKDIMDEIESLEEDYAEAEESDNDVSSEEETTVEATAEQSKPEEDIEEVSASAEDSEDDSDEVEDILGEDDDVQEEENVVELAHAPKAKPISHSGGSDVALNASGSMDISLNFEFNGVASNIVISKGLVKINLPGVDVSFDESKGCQIHADNGMTFQLPLEVKKAS